MNDFNWQTKQKNIFIDFKFRLIENKACDYAGEKLAWWFGITKPKFLYEINEYEEMMREQERRAQLEDPTDELVVGPGGEIIMKKNKSLDPESLQQPETNDEHLVADHRFAPPVDPADAQIRLYEQKEANDSNKTFVAKKKPLLQS